MNLTQDSQKLETELLSLWWIRGLPAVVVASFSCVIGIYLLYILPAHLPNYYETTLEDSLELYESEADGLPTDTLIQLGNKISIAYARAKSYRGGVSDWAEALFYEQHVARLLTIESKSRDSIDGLSENITKFRDKRNKLLDELKDLESPHSRNANLLLAKKFVSQHQKADDQLVENLQTLFSDRPADHELGSTLTQVLINQAWHARAQDGTPGRSLLESAQQVVNKLDKEADFTKQIRLRLSPFLTPTHTADLASEIVNSQQTHSFRVVLAAFVNLGDWENAESWIGQKFAVANKQEEMELRSDTSRLILDLFLSGLVYEKHWAANCADGFRLAKALYPQSPRFHSVVWRLARLHAAETQTIASESILVSSLPERFLILALSNAIRGNENSERYLNQAFAADSDTLSKLVAISISEAKSSDESTALVALLDSHKPQSPEMHLALAALYFEKQDYAKLAKALDAAAAKLGHTPLHKQLTTLLSQLKQ